MSFAEVTLYLLDGFKLTCLLFVLTLVISLPLGLLISFCTMSKIKPVSAVFKVIVWIVRGVPLMLQIFIIYYVPGFLDFNIFGYDFAIFNLADTFIVVAIILILIFMGDKKCKNLDQKN